MADAESTNLELVLPEVGASTDTWGTKLNSNFIALDALFNEDATLKVTAGGSGLATFGAAGALPYSTAATVLAALALGTARQLLQVNAGATAPQWASNIDIPGTLDVTGAAVFDSTALFSGVGTFAAGVAVTGGTAGTGKIVKTATGGLVLQGVAGSSFDLAVLNAAGSSLMYNDTGTHSLVLSATNLGFFGAVAAAKPTGVAVSATGIHAALVTLGLIAGP